MTATLEQVQETENKNWTPQQKDSSKGFLNTLRATRSRSHHWAPQEAVGQRDLASMPRETCNNSTPHLAYRQFSEVIIVNGSLEVGLGHFIQPFPTYLAYFKKVFQKHGLTRILI